MLLYFLALMAILPVAAIRAARNLDAGKPLPPKTRYLLLSMLTQVFLAALAVLVAGRVGIRLWNLPRLGTGVVLGGVVFFAVLTITIPLRWRRAQETQRKRLRLIVPEHPREYPLWIALALTAGIGEELVWRGVLFSLVARYTGSVAIAAALSALHFGICHIVQGWRSVALIAAIGLVAQAMTISAGSLFPAMLLHFLYDAVAGIWFQQLDRVSALPAAAVRSDA